MGLFSWDCKGCGASVKAPYDIPEELEWQNEAVFTRPNGSVAIGEYDGYGRVEGSDFVDGPEPCVWHKRCWEEAGKPAYSEPSGSSEDQGFFYDRDAIEGD